MIVKHISSNALLPSFSGLCLFILCDLTQVPHPHCVLRSRAVTAVPTAGAATRVSEFICATAKRRAEGSTSSLVIFVSSRRGGRLSHDI